MGTSTPMPVLMRDAADAMDRAATYHAAMPPTVGAAVAGSLNRESQEGARPEAIGSRGATPCG